MDASECAGDATIGPGERVWVGVDVGGERSASAVVWVTQDLRVGCQVFTGDEAVLAVARRPEIQPQSPHRLFRRLRAEECPRLDIRHRGDDGTTAVATLNGTLCAMTRTIIALLENGQQADGSVRLPAVLHPLLGEVLEPIA